MNNIHATDLNLIRVFDALLEERSVTRAGERLGLSQSAVSHALAKLRLLLNDELFVRGPQGMHPTPRAMELAHPLRAALAQISDALAAPRFDPATSAMTFVVATSDYYIAGLFPRIMARIRHEAPQIRLWLRMFNDLNLVEELDRGTLHLVVGAFGRIPSRFRREPLNPVDMVWIMRRDHPAAAQPLTLEVLGRWPHVDILLSGRASAEPAAMQDQEGLERSFVTSDPTHLDALLREAGLTRQVGATVPLILAAPPLVAVTDMIALVPRSIAEAYRETYGLALFDSPYPRVPTQIDMLSHNTYGAHPAVAWLRGMLHQAGREGSGGAG